MTAALQRVEKALDDIRQGKMVVLRDNPSRENEGDIIIAAEHITPETMNFMIRNGTGIVCLSMIAPMLNQMNLPLMVPPIYNTCLRGTAFTLSIDARYDITTGVSAADRAKTVLAAIRDGAHADDITRPGHVFPLLAKEGGVLERQGHTEGSVDLARLAGLKPAGVICEVMNPDGSMASGHTLTEFCEKHQLTLLSIDDLIDYRLYHETLIEDETSAKLPLAHYGDFTITAIREKISGREHVIIEKEMQDNNQPTLVRVHSCCLTGDTFQSKRCDCYAQLHHALERISKEGGILIYLNQEGRGIGLFNKIKAYALQDQGLDTVQANLELGLPIDSRNFAIAAQYLRKKGIAKIRLLTNNPEKVDDLKRYGVPHIVQESMPTFCNGVNEAYLQTKVSKLKHRIDLKDKKDKKNE